MARAAHTHALYRDDNSVVYYHLEEATRGTSYAASIKPSQRGEDGRGAWKALTSQYAGQDKWEAEIKCQEQLLHTRVWKGQSNFSLEHFIFPNTGMLLSPCKPVQNMCSMLKLKSDKDRQMDCRAEI